MLTRRAATAPNFHVRTLGRAVTTWRRLLAEGWTPARIRAHLDARQWRRYGRAIVMHNGPLHAEEIREVALPTRCGAHCSGH